MKFKTKELVAALEVATKLIHRRNTIPVLSCLLLQAQSGAVKLVSTDLDIRIEVEVPAEGVPFTADIVIPEPGALIRALKLSGASEVILDRGEGIIGVLAGGLSLTVQTDIPPEDFPDMPGLGSTIFSGTLGADAVKTVRRVFGAVSHEETRYYLNGIYFHGGLGPWAYTVCATDGHRLYTADMPIPDADGTMGTGPGIILPHSTLTHLLAATGRQKREPVGFRIGSSSPNAAPTMKDMNTRASMVEFKIGNVTILSKTIDGTFPDYNRVIPADATVIATFDRAQLLRAVRCVGLDTSVAIELDGGKGSISCKWACAQNTASMDVAYEGDVHGVRFGVNSRYLSGLLDIVEGDRVTLAFVPRAHEINPITVVSPTDAGFKGVVMPMRI